MATTMMSRVREELERGKAMNVKAEKKRGEDARKLKDMEIGKGKVEGRIVSVSKRVYTLPFVVLMCFTSKVILFSHRLWEYNFCYLR